LPDDVVAFGDQARGPIKTEIGKCLAKAKRELADLVTATQRLMQRVLKAASGPVTLTLHHQFRHAHH
jgi:hypothetical protein